MVTVLDWRRSEDLRDVVHLSVQALVEGNLVGFPTESTYEIAASSTNFNAVQRLDNYCRNIGEQEALMLRSASEASDFFPELSPVAKRIIEYGFPGSVIVELPGGGGATHDCFQEPIRSWLDGRASIRLRMPQHEAALQAASMLAGPLLLAPAKTADGKPLLRIEPNRHLPMKVIVDDGPTQLQGECTLIRVDDRLCRVLRRGNASWESIHELAQFVILLVCTGNTCRSPMAQVLLESKLKKKFPNAWSRSSVSPIAVYSAGTSASVGSPASSEAIYAMRERGLDLTSHESTQLTHRLIDRADWILTMTHSHRQTILSRWPHLASKTFTIASNQEISDPFGGPIEVYRGCAAQLSSCLDEWVAKLDESLLPIWEHPTTEMNTNPSSTGKAS